MQPAQTHTRPLPPLPTHLQRYSATPSPDAGPSSATNTPQMRARSLVSPAGAGPDMPRAEQQRGKARGRDDADEEEVKSAKEAKPATKKVKVGARASIACKTCRKRKVRCTSEWPACTFCASREFKCEYEGHPAENGESEGAISFNYAAQAVPVAALPPTALLLEALDPFFLHNYDTFYFLHRPTLVDQIREGTAPKELLYSILAFAARHHQGLRELHPSSPHAASEYFALQASRVLAFRSIGPPSPNPDDPEVSLIRCQSLLILGLWECTEGRENVGWMRIGYAIRMAQILRLGFQDEDDTSPAHGPPQYLEQNNPLDSEIRRRTFWSCFLLDRTITDGKERPFSLRPPTASSLRLPCSEPDFAAGRFAGRGARFEADIPPWNRSARVDAHDAMEPEADLYGHTLRISEIWNSIVSYFGVGGRNFDRRAPWLPESTFATLERAVRIWEARLPGVYRYNDANLVAHTLVGQGRLFGMLHLLHACSNLVLHRDYLPFLPPLDYNASKGPTDGEPLYGQPYAPAGWWENSLAQAIEAAGVISDISSSLSQHGAQITHPFAGFALVAAGTMHAHLKYWPSSARSKPVNSSFYFDQDVAILNNLKDIYPIASNWCEAIIKLDILYSNVVRGVIDVDPSKVRAGVIKLLRTVRDDDAPPTSSSRPLTPSAATPTSLNALNIVPDGLSGPAAAEMFDAASFLHNHRHEGDGMGGGPSDGGINTFALDLSVLDNMDWGSWGDFTGAFNLAPSGGAW